VGWNSWEEINVATPGVNLVDRHSGHDG
jgi:hypothetical protein